MSNYPEFSSHGYQIKRQLGQNRLGGRFTYLATNNKTQQPVVIKQFQFAQPGANWGEYDAYESEIKLLQQLESPSIPRYLDSFETPTGFCLVQEYKKAPSLAQPRHFTPEEIKQIAIAVLEILMYLQRQRQTVIHRDIKPENILVDRSRQIKVYLVDFGAVQDRATAEGVTFTVVGTSGYAPPEQLWGRAVPASDLYALGATLIHLLTGTAPADLPQRQMRLQFADRVSLKPNFAQWLEKLTEPAPERRFSSARQALLALQAGRDSTEKAGQATSRSVRYSRLAGLAFLQLVVSVMGSLMISWDFDYQGHKAQQDQVTKGKQAEARQNIGAMNRAQQAYYLEKTAFSN